jgi:hypothetical protein
MKQTRDQNEFPQTADRAECFLALQIVSKSHCRVSAGNLHWIHSPDWPFARTQFGSGDLMIRWENNILTPLAALHLWRGMFVSIPDTWKGLIFLAYVLPTRFNDDPARQCVCMYEGWAKRSGPCTATFSDLFCFPFLIKPFINPTHRMKCRTLFMGPS